jgi:nucleoside-diphosphate-sugar epimerase
VRPGSDTSRLDRLVEKVGERFALRRGNLISKEAAAASIEGAHVVHHLAASLKGSPADMALNTVVTTRNLLDAMLEREEPPKLVLVSSFSVYGTANLPRGATVNEHTPLETEPVRRDPYSQVKLRQEQLCWERREEQPYPLVVLRPGVIYGPTGGALSGRIGLQLPGLYLHLGDSNILPLTYVDNCAEAIAIAGEREDAVGKVFNVHDDDLPTARAYLRRYTREVRPLRKLTVPYPLTMLGSKIVEWYHRYSKGQLPAIFTPYKTAVAWGGNHFDNSRLKSLGWKPIVSTEEGIERTFAHMRSQAS